MLMTFPVHGLNMRSEIRASIAVSLSVDIVFITKSSLLSPCEISEVDLLHGVFLTELSRLVFCFSVSSLAFFITFIVHRLLMRISDMRGGPCLQQKLRPCRINIGKYPN